MPAESCPTTAQFDDLMANRLSHAEADKLRQHMASCSSCQARVRGEDPAKPAFSFLSPPQGPGELGWLDQHRILGVLGEGGMSIVFDAEDTHLHRRVALKVLRPHITDVRTQKRFLQEGRLLAGLPHEHIVTVFQVGEANGVPYLTLEKLEGESLETRLERDKWLPLKEALSLAREAAEGLDVAHEKGLVHRDIKPANIWLETRNGRFRRVKLIDFGVARQVKGENLTTVGLVLGTPMYMSPEQAAGKTVDARADIYSLGCVLYRMLTGKAVFAGQHTQTIHLLEAVIRGEAPNVQQDAPQLPAAVAQLIQEMLATKPDDRPASARAVVERLRRLEAGNLDLVPPPVVTASPSPSARTIRRPGLIGIWIGAGAIVAALVLSIVVVYQNFNAPSPDDGNKPLQGPPIKVGILHSQTDVLSLHERPVIKATEMAIDEINKSGGVLGRPVEAIIADGASSEETFALGARKLLDEDGVEVLFGCWTSSSRKRVSSICEKKNRLLFFPAGHEGLEESANVVHLGGSPNQTIIPLMRWAYTEKRCSQFFFVGSEDVYSHTIADIIAHEIKGLKGTLLGTRFVALRETVFGNIVEEIKKAKPQMLLIALDGASNVALCQALRAAGLKQADLPCVWLSVSESELSLFRISDVVGDYSVACYFTTISRPENVQFLRRFHDRFGMAERVNDAMESAYFGVYLWKKAVEEAGSTDTEAVRKALEGLSVDAPEGRVRLASTLYAYRHALVGQIEDKSGALPVFRIVHRSADPLPPDPFPSWKTKDQWRAMLQELYKKWGNRWEKPR